MAKEKPVFNHKFDIGDAIAMPWNLPGGRNFLFRVILWGGALLLAVYAIFGRQFISAYADFLVTAMEFENTASTAGPEGVTAMMSDFWGLMGSAFLMSIFGWFVLVAMETAMHKNVFRGTDHGMFPLRFGKDELRVLLVQFVIAVLVYIIYTAGLFGLIALAAGLGIAAQGNGIIALIVALLAIAGFIAFFVIVIRVAMGWAPAAAMSVRDNKQRIFEGWAAAKGRNWPLFGTYLVVFLIGSIAIYVVLLLGMFLAFGNMEFLSAFSGNSDNPSAVFEQMGEALSQPRVMIPLVITTIVYILIMAVFYMHIWGVATYVALLDAREQGMIASK